MFKDTELMVDSSISKFASYSNQIRLSGISEYRCNLYSLDGKLVYQKSGAVENAGNVDLWEIGNMASSMYLFRILVKAESGDEEEIKGKLVVVR